MSINLKELNSYFVVVMPDETTFQEGEYGWLEHSELLPVTLDGIRKVAYLHKGDVASLSMFHMDMQASIIPQPGQRVYQEIRARTKVMKDGTHHHEIIGRFIGRVEDDKVIEEFFLNGDTGVVEVTKRYVNRP